MPDSPRPEGLPAPRSLQVECSRHFTEWLARQSVSLTFSTYQAGKVFLIGLKSSERLSVFERTFERCMGLWSDGQTLWLASAFQLWRLENSLADGETSDGYDRVFIPRGGFVTGDLDVHDIAVDGDGRMVFITTLFSCLATVSDRDSFSVLWQPPFVSRLAAEDRCHLNGLAMQNGRPKFVTACGRSDVADGWRDVRANGGCVIDVASNEIVVTGLSMPHSPRCHDGKLWLLDSGTGYFGFADCNRGTFERVAFCPGFARGLTFVGDYAVVGLSKARQDRTFQGLPLDEELARHGAVPRCGLIVIDTRTGDMLHWLRLEGAADELYDVAALPGVRCPKAIGFKTDEIRYQVTFETPDGLRRWSGQPRDKK